MNNFDNCIQILERYDLDDNSSPKPSEIGTCFVCRANAYIKYSRNLECEICKNCFYKFELDTFFNDIKNLPRNLELKIYSYTDFYKYIDWEDEEKEHDNIYSHLRLNKCEDCGTYNFDCNLEEVTACLCDEWLCYLTKKKCRYGCTYKFPCGCYHMIKRYLGWIPPHVCELHNTYFEPDQVWGPVSWGTGYHYRVPDDDDIEPFNYNVHVRTDDDNMTESKFVGNGRPLHYNMNTNWELIENDNYYYY